MQVYRKSENALIHGHGKGGCGRWADGGGADSGHREGIRANRCSGGAPASAGSGAAAAALADFSAATSP